MTRTYRKYTKEMLEEAARNSVSYSGVLRFFGLKQSGGGQSHIKRMMIQLEVSTDHFTGQAHNKGKPDCKRLSADQILIYDRLHGLKEKTQQLRRALLEINRPHLCAICGQTDTYFYRKLVLQIDHINGDPLDNQVDNLRFLCPNCHSQTPTFGNNRRKAT